ncbi:MAG: outer membrane beta-barrel protein, partial [Rhizobiales bacterium]|nr:outer membrane beta-barrel protein [Hyphomicrobiales bacterium]
MFRIYPTLGVDAVYSTNPANLPSDPQDAFGVRIRPSFRFESDWSRHSWTGDASASLLEYEGDGEAAVLDANAATRFRLDILRTTRAEFDARYTLEEADGDTAETGYDQNFGASASLTHDFGQFEGRLRAGASVQLYDDLELLDGGTEDNGDREYA